MYRFSISSVSSDKQNTRNKDLLSQNVYIFFKYFCATENFSYYFIRNFDKVERCKKYVPSISNIILSQYISAFLLRHLSLQWQYLPSCKNHVPCPRRNKSRVSAEVGEHAEYHNNPIQRRYFFYEYHNNIV